MAQVMLHPNRKLPFQRCVRRAAPKTGGKGKVLKTLTFESGVAVTLDGQDLKAVSKDLAKGVLIEVEKDARGKLRVKQVASEETVSVPRAEYEALVERAANYDRDIAAAREEGVREGQTQALGELVEA